MKKRIAILCGFLIFTSFLFTQNSSFTGNLENAEEKNKEKNEQNRLDWIGTNSGDYVIYRDYSWKDETWVGFLYYNKNTIGAFLYTDNGNVFPKILFSGEELDGEFITAGQKIISERNDSPNYAYAINYLMKLLPNLYKWKEKPTMESLVVKKSTKNIFEPEFGGESKIHFSSFIPLFFMDSILNKDQKTILKLQEMGLAQTSDDFFNFRPVSIPSERVSSFTLNTTAKQTKKTINGVTVNLDSQWEQTTENTFFLDSTAFLAVAPIDFQNLPNIRGNEEAFIIKYLSSSGLDRKVLLDTMDVLGNKEKFKIISSVYDTKANTVNKAIKLVVKEDDLKYTLIILTVNNSAYKKYKEYFDNLF